MNIFIQYGLAIYLLPLAAFLIQIFWGRRLPRKGDWVSIGAVLLTLVLSTAMLASLLLDLNPDFHQEASFTWLDLGRFQIRVGFLMDTVTVIMLFVVALISSASHIFSIKYMEGDPAYSRYYAYLSLFTFSMNGIVLSNNLLLLYVSWELVGLSSYLLIGFWYEKPSAALAGMKAFLTNRVGDIGFFIGILLMFTATGSFLYRDMFAGVAAGTIAGTTLTLAGIGLFMGAVGKSSQVPLHIWLPDAMEGPTPVSALMHAATMVAAGVFMMVRFFPILTPDALLVVAYIGGITALFASLIAITQTDIKKVLAYSTVSQLGYMILAVGTGAYVAAFFHLVTHAVFKSNLFYGSGSVIHAMHHGLERTHRHDLDPQDMRNMGGLKAKLPLTYWSMVASTLAIAGIPFFSGFLSKDQILAGTLAFAEHHPVHFLLPVFGFGAALITAFYMTRLIFLTFHQEPRHPEVFAQIQRAPFEMALPLTILGTGSLYVFYTLPSVNPFGGEGWFQRLVEARDSLAGGPAADWMAEQMHHAHLPTMILSIAVALAGLVLGWLMYGSRRISAEALARRFPRLHDLSYHKFYVDELYAKLLYDPLLKLADFVGWLDWDWYDKKIIDGFGRWTTRIARWVGTADYDGLDQGLVDGVGRTLRAVGGGMQRLQTGRIQNYILLATAGVIIILLSQVF
ncbi:MAG: NADH-quinone oxidoreductase subunit L [Candidatus Neomarinimicrobiota bacterium]|nr:MAG: NADH-quinone oxidoreductase subunit L [Candidatus Neomarinimicrobiota bacterium]